VNTVVITGASSGIGLETAKILTQNGFHVIGVSRSEENCKRAKEKILSENPNAQITFMQADLMQQREVVKVAESITLYLNNSGNGELYALINNAACIRSWYMTTEEGYEQQFALNHLAGFLLTYKLLPALIKAKGCVIMTGSGSHRGIKVHWDDIMLNRRYNPLIAYKQSKLCNLLFAKGLNDRYAKDGIRAYVVDPGLVNTDIGNKGTGGLVNFVWSLRKKHGVSPDVPAKTYAFLCEQKDRQNGLYYYLCKEIYYSKEVTSENANRLFELSERLCGIRYEGKEMVAV
jgi:NAD(P)-dependent dehydrogenase (short-subunit alcohol dehydrogenase family)